MCIVVSCLLCIVVSCLVCIVVSCLVCIVVSCLVCIVVSCLVCIAISCLVCIVVSCLVCIVVSCLACIFVSCLLCILAVLRSLLLVDLCVLLLVVLRVLLSSYVYLSYYVCITLFTLDAGLLARSQFSEGSATGHLDTGFSWFPCVSKQMLRWFPTFQVASTRFSYSPPDLNSLVTNLIFYIHVK